VAVNDTHFKIRTNCTEVAPRQLTPPPQGIDRPFNGSLKEAALL
jgi:hypothetical protein